MLFRSLALQGGGAHGAFTWGVFDRLLQEPWLRIEGISGTSAGAMNAAVLADGFAEGGSEGARARAHSGELPSAFRLRAAPNSLAEAVRRPLKFALNPYGGNVSVV